MEVFLGKVTQQAMNYAIRSGITITTSYAIKQSARLLRAVEDTTERDELQNLQERLDSKIRIVSPAIDMIELISARGNTSLESAVTLTKQLRWEIQQLGQRLQTAANAEEFFQRRSATVKDQAQHTLELKQIAQAIRKLLTRIDDAVPLINLAITASGANLSSTLPTTVSPSRLLQASTFLTAGDSQYVNSLASSMQIGPTFTLSMYMLFTSHLRSQTEHDIRGSTWKEVIHKAVVRLMRVSIDSLKVLPSGSRLEAEVDNPQTQDADGDYFARQLMASTKADEYAYQLVVVEDLDDDRVHTFEDDDTQPGPYGDINLAGIREAVPVHELSKIFYADTGKILNIGSEDEINSPVLLLKRDIHAVPPRRMLNEYGGSNQVDDSWDQRSSPSKSPATPDRQDGKSLPVSTDHPRPPGSTYPNKSEEHIAASKDPWRIPADLDPEWIAFEVYTAAEDSDTDTDEQTTPSTKPCRPSRTMSTSKITSRFSQLSVKTPPVSSSPSQQKSSPQPSQQPNSSLATLPPIRTSLSLLETLLRLLSLQQFQQAPHLSIPDELLTFFLSESASTGAASNDVEERRRLREEARRRVGFDPYDESPVKRRGEEYQYRSSENGGWDAEAQDGFTEERYGTPTRSVPHEDEGYDTRSNTIPPSSSQLPSTPQRAASDSPAECRYGVQPPGSAAMSISTGPSPSPVGRPPPLMTRQSDGGRYRLRHNLLPAVAPGRKGSPLARSSTGFTDEGLGTNPSSIEGTR